MKSKALNFLFILFFVLYGPIAICKNKDELPLALIYKGPGACASCPEAAAKIAILAGLKVKYVGPSEIQAALKLKPAIYIQGGGDDAVDISKAMSPESMKSLRNYVKNGGKYLGICAGGYFAGLTVDDKELVFGLKILPGDADVYDKKSHKAKLESVLWEGKIEKMYIQDAPKFIMNKNAKYEKIATYPNGEIAALITPHGNGWVAVSGPHPEATKDWASEDKLPANSLASIKLGAELILKLLNKGRPDISCLNSEAPSNLMKLENDVQKIQNYH